MDILVVGGGGREHAIVKKLYESARVDKLYCAPGNAGISEMAECIPVSATDIEGIVNKAKELKVDMVFVAPDDPLTLGLVDRLAEEDIDAFGPTARAAELEGSKVFSKNLMKKYGIPTAEYEVFTSHADAAEYIEKNEKYPVVIKADGLALGKGAIIVNNKKEALDALTKIMKEKAFGDSGNRVVIEEFMTGPELTVLAFCDGKTVVPMCSAQDHKRAFDGDEGPNTGGMGAFSPSRYYTEETAKECSEKIFLPTVRAMAEEGREFKGVIYFQMMLTKEGPKVVEYNARFGDPEAQVVLPRLESDLVDIMEAVNYGRLDEIEISWSDKACACVVAASGGYPVKYDKGYEITGIEDARDTDVFVYEAGTAFGDGGKKVTSGGRVLCVSALGDSLEQAIEKAYAGIEKIKFEKMFYRHDIGKK